MSKDYNPMADTVWPGIRSGAAAAGLTMLLLLPTAWGMYLGKIPMTNLYLFGGVTACLSTMLSALLFTGRKREGRMALPLITVICCTLLLLIMTAALPSIQWKPVSILITSAFELAGAELGMMTKASVKHKPGKRNTIKKYK